MSEAEVSARTPYPHTTASLARDLRAGGLGAGDHVMVHVALSSIGWIVGGAGALIQALQDVVTPDGTILMPAHTPANSDPALWQNPPVPADWVPVIRDNMPAYDPARSACRELGAVADLFRSLPDVRRSPHPHVSCAAWGRLADVLTHDHPLEQAEGPLSPIGRLYDCDGRVLLIGVGHDNNTSLHLAEYRADYPGKTTHTQGAAVMHDGQRRWVIYQTLAVDSDDFPHAGAAYEASAGLTPGKLGNADLRLMQQRPLVDFATAWMTTHRGRP
ncbi:MAG: AAC(3) family N-acetyltransferase [Rhodobacterales bacterium]|nr:AAC(3) family N-acetyltransferase [Rhodobacterales bacterium]